MTHTSTDQLLAAMTVGPDISPGISPWITLNTDTTVNFVIVSLSDSPLDAYQDIEVYFEWGGVSLTSALMHTVLPAPPIVVALGVSFPHLFLPAGSQVRIRMVWPEPVGAPPLLYRSMLQAHWNTTV